MVCYLGRFFSILEQALLRELVDVDGDYPVGQALLQVFGVLRIGLCQAANSMLKIQASWHLGVVE